MPSHFELDHRLARNFGLRSSKLTASSLQRIPVEKRLHLAKSLPYVTADYRKPLLVLMEDKNPKVRYELAESLGRTRENSVLEPLQHLAGRPDNGVFVGQPHFDCPMTSGKSSTNYSSRVFRAAKVRADASSTAASETVLTRRVRPCANGKGGMSMA